MLNNGKLQKQNRRTFHIHTSSNESQQSLRFPTHSLSILHSIRLDWIKVKMRMRLEPCWVGVEKFLVLSECYLTWLSLAQWNGKNGWVWFWQVDVGIAPKNGWMENCLVQEERKERNIGLQLLGHSTNIYTGTLKDFLSNRIKQNKNTNNRQIRLDWWDLGVEVGKKEIVWSWLVSGYCYRDPDMHVVRILWLANTFLSTLIFYYYTAHEESYLSILSSFRIHFIPSLKSRRLRRVVLIRLQWNLQEFQYSRNSYWLNKLSKSGSLLYIFL